MAYADEDVDFASDGHYKVVRKGVNSMHGIKVVGGMHRFLKRGNPEDFDKYKNESDNHQPMLSRIF